ncbi:hypothetical protein BGZ83_011009 [Gryganskiella cystojenkinii]|nr:hypothetical protein BGZ83_011009 [Gryganskiella cystojenkinii]
MPLTDSTVVQDPSIAAQQQPPVQVPSLQPQPWRPPLLVQQLQQQQQQQQQLQQPQPPQQQEVLQLQQQEQRMQMQHMSPQHQSQQRANMQQQQQLQLHFQLQQRQQQQQQQQQQPQLYSQLVQKQVPTMSNHLSETVPQYLTSSSGPPLHQDPSFNLQMQHQQQRLQQQQQQQHLQLQQLQQQQQLQLQLQHLHQPQPQPQQHQQHLNQQEQQQQQQQVQHQLHHQQAQLQLQMQTQDSQVASTPMQHTMGQPGSVVSNQISVPHSQAIYQPQLSSQVIGGLSEVDTPEERESRVVLKLMEFAQQLSLQSENESLQFWQRLVFNFYGEGGRLRYILVNPSSQETRTYELVAATLPRYYLGNVEAGVNEIQLMFDKATVHHSSSPLFAECSNMTLVSHFKNGSRVIATGTLKATFSSDYKFDLLELKTVDFREYPSADPVEISDVFSKMSELIQHSAHTKLGAVGPAYSAGVSSNGSMHGLNQLSMSPRSMKRRTSVGCSPGDSGVVISPAPSPAMAIAQAHVSVGMITPMMNQNISNISVVGGDYHSPTPGQGAGLGLSLTGSPRQASSPSMMSPTFLPSAAASTPALPSKTTKRIRTASATPTLSSSNASIPSNSVKSGAATSNNGTGRSRKGGGRKDSATKRKSSTVAEGVGGADNHQPSEEAISVTAGPQGRASGSSTAVQGKIDSLMVTTNPYYSTTVTLSDLATPEGLLTGGSGLLPFTAASTLGHEVEVSVMGDQNGTEAGQGTVQGSQLEQGLGRGSGLGLVPTMMRPSGGTELDFQPQQYLQQQQLALQQQHQQIRLSLQQQQQQQLLPRGSGVVAETPVVLLNDKEKHWLEGAIKDKLLRLIDFNDIHHLEMGVASGGFGIIHAGRWRGMRVAVKVLYNPADFIQEVGIHKLVQDSENIVKFYGITQMKSTGDYGMVLQFAGKGSLRDYLSRHFESLDWVNKMRLARDVAAGISFIHEDNICHHDLHSRNVLIDQSGRALITDFGLSRYVNKANSNNGVRGVVPYISPERLKNSPFDHSSDVYSLGVIMWELSSGYPPFDRDGENYLLPFQIMRGRREEIVPGTPVEYSDLYQLCWDGEPVNRPSLHTILKHLDSMLATYNGQDDIVVRIDPIHCLPGTRSLPTQTHAVLVDHEPLRRSAPINGLAAPRIAASRSVGVYPTQQVANISPLVPKHGVSKQHHMTTSVNTADVDSVLAEEYDACRVIDDKSLDNQQSPVSTTIGTHPKWIQTLNTRRQNGLGNGSTLPRPLSPIVPSQKPIGEERPDELVAASPSHSMPSPIPMPGQPYQYPQPAIVPSPHPHNRNVYVPPVQVQSVAYPSSNTTSSLTLTELNVALNNIVTGSNGQKQKIDSASSSRSNSGSPWMPRNGKTNIKDFFTACRNGNLEAVHWHLMQGARVMEPYDTMSGRTPLHAAAMSDSFEVMKLLCESAGSLLNMNELDDSSQTPLHLLTQYGRNSHELLVYMLEKGANPNAQDSEKRTPLMTTFILNDNAQLVETLLDYGADPNIRCQENNALAEASIRVRFQCVKVLLETDLSMSEQSSLEHAMDVCYRVTETVNRNQVLSLLVRWRHAEGIQKRQTLARMILNGSLQLGERRIDQRRIARQVLASAGSSH